MADSQRSQVLVFVLVPKMEAAVSICNFQKQFLIEAVIILQS